MADSYGDFLSQYKSISSKLKKRFLRKTNVAEPSDQFGALGAQCEREELPQYAGLCYLAVSRCESSLNNTSGEAWALVKAGRQFLRAHAKAEAGGLISPGGEQLEAAVSCLSRASRLWQTEVETPLAAGLALETGTALHSLSNRLHQAAACFAQAAQLLASNPLLQLHALSQLASCRIKMGDHDGALAVFNQMVSVVETAADPPFGVYCDVLLRCEINRVLLLLLLRPPPQRLPSSLAVVLERYSWLADNNTSPASWMSEELFILLQSLVMACQAQDSESLRAIESDLWKHLDNEQRSLLRSLVETMSTASDN